MPQQDKGQGTLWPASVVKVVGELKGSLLLTIKWLAAVSFITQIWPKSPLQANSGPQVLTTTESPLLSPQS